MACSNRSVVALTRHRSTRHCLGGPIVGELRFQAAYNGVARFRKPAKYSHICMTIMPWANSFRHGESFTNSIEFKEFTDQFNGPLVLKFKTKMALAAKLPLVRDWNHLDICSIDGADRRKHPVDRK